jgi:hypothetical protein
LRGVRELAETSLLNDAEAGSWLWAAFERMARRSANNEKMLATAPQHEYCCSAA